nr:hypothetical protein [Nostoc sp. CreGUA01]
MGSGALGMGDGALGMGHRACVRGHGGTLLLTPHPLPMPYAQIQAD